LNISILSKTKKAVRALLDEYSVAARYLFLLICGFAASLIFGALVGYSYSEKTTSFALFAIISPFSSYEGLYDAFGKLLSCAVLDTSFIALAFLSGLSCLCRSILSLLNIIRGFLLGILTCIYSSGALENVITAPLGGSAVVVITELVAASVVLIFFSSIAEAASFRFIASAQSEAPILLTKSFFSYFLLFMLCLGATLLLRIFSSAILQMLILI
jgi:hypothetical protein